jgi:hypothetical protein
MKKYDFKEDYSTALSEVYPKLNEILFLDNDIVKVLLQLWLVDIHGKG